MRTYFVDAALCSQINAAALNATTGHGVAALRVLLSFHYFRRKPVAQVVALFPGIDLRVMLDSGGFSAASLGERISLADYCRYIRQNAAHVESYANLDVIGDPVKSARNLRIMRAEGLAPFPVFHVGSDWQHLDAMLEERPEMMALGGMVPHLKGRQGLLRVWLAQAFARIRERSPASRVHGFGLGSSVDLIDEFPWSSVDSSAWTSAYQFRTVDVFDEERGQYVKVKCTSGDDSPMKHAALLRRYGFRPGQFYPASRFNYTDAGALAVLSVLRAEAWVNARKEKVR